MEFWTETGAGAAGTESQTAQQLHNGEKHSQAAQQHNEKSRFHFRSGFRLIKYSDSLRLFSP